LHVKSSVNNGIVVKNAKDMAYFRSTVVVVVVVVTPAIARE